MSSEVKETPETLESYRPVLATQVIRSKKKLVRGGMSAPSFSTRVVCGEQETRSRNRETEPEEQMKRLSSRVRRWCASRRGNGHLMLSYL
jgi:hypothetical protein